MYVSYHSVLLYIVGYHIVVARSNTTVVVLLQSTQPILVVPYSSTDPRYTSYIICLQTQQFGKRQLVAKAQHTAAANYFTPRRRRQIKIHEYNVKYEVVCMYYVMYNIINGVWFATP